MSYILKPRDYKQQFVESYVAELVRTVNLGELAPRDLCRHLKAVRLVEQARPKKRPSQVENLFAELAQLLTARKLSERAYYLLRRIALPEVIETRTTTYLTQEEGEILREYIVGDLPNLEVYGELREAGFGLKYAQEVEVEPETEAEQPKGHLFKLPFLVKYYDTLLNAISGNEVKYNQLDSQLELMVKVEISRGNVGEMLSRLYWLDNELDVMWKHKEISRNAQSTLRAILEPEIAKLEKEKSVPKEGI